MGAERTGLHRAAASGETQRPGEGPASLRCVQALRGGVHRCPPAGEPPSRIRDQGPGPDDDTQQIADRSASPAPHAGADRVRTFRPPCTLARGGAGMFRASGWRAVRGRPAAGRGGPRRRRERRSAAAAGPPRARGSRPRRRAARRCGCRSGSRSAGRPGGRSAPPCRWPATAGSRARSRGPPWPAGRRRGRCSPAPGLSAEATNVAGSSDQSTMSIFSPCSSLMTLRTRWPIGPDAGALGVEPGHLRADGDLRAVPGLAGHRHDLDAAVGDLGHLEGEQLAHQVRVGARDGDLRAAEGAGDRHHVGLDPAAVRVLLAGHLLGLRAGPPRPCRCRSARCPARCGGRAPARCR